jgi:hypothetical protein
MHVHTLESTSRTIRILELTSLQGPRHAFVFKVLAISQGYRPLFLKVVSLKTSPGS